MGKLAKPVLQRTNESTGPLRDSNSFPTHQFGKNLCSHLTFLLVKLSFFSLLVEVPTLFSVGKKKGKMLKCCWWARRFSVESYRYYIHIHLVIKLLYIKESQFSTPVYGNRNVYTASF